MSTLEEFERRVSGLETPFEEDVKEILSLVFQKVDGFHKKAEQGKPEIDKKTEKTKVQLAKNIAQTPTNLIGGVEKARAQLMARIEQKRADVAERTEQAKTELFVKKEKDTKSLPIGWLGPMLGFLALSVKAMGHTLSFAV